MRPSKIVFDRHCGTQMSALAKQTANLMSYLKIYSWVATLLVQRSISNPVCSGHYSARNYCPPSTQEITATPLPTPTPPPRNAKNVEQRAGVLWDKEGDISM